MSCDAVLGRAFIRDNERKHLYRCTVPNTCNRYNLNPSQCLVTDDDGFSGVRTVQKHEPQFTGNCEPVGCRIIQRHVNDLKLL